MIQRQGHIFAPAFEFKKHFAVSDLCAIILIVVSKKGFSQKTGRIDLYYGYGIDLQRVS